MKPKTTKNDAQMAKMTPKMPKMNPKWPKIMPEMMPKRPKWLKNVQNDAQNGQNDIDAHAPKYRNGRLKTFFEMTSTKWGSDFNSPHQIWLGS